MSLTDRDFGDFYDRFRPYVYALAARVSRDKHGAEDITQEVFLTLWQRIERFDPDRGSMPAWVGTITHHTAVAWMRRQVAARRRDQGDAMTEIVDDTAEDTALRAVLADRVRRVVASLPPAKRRAVELAYVDGLTYRQVADHTGVPEGTAKTRLRDALATIARALEGDVAEGVA